MSNVCQEKSERKQSKLSGWDRAIEDAKKKIRRLEFSISVFRKRKRSGESWPGTTT